MEEALKKLTLEFFGKRKHKIRPERLLAMDDAVLLDVRAEEEVNTVSFGLKHHVNISQSALPKVVLQHSPQKHEP